MADPTCSAAADDP